MENSKSLQNVSPDYFPGVDLAKFIMSIFVVAIHTNALSILPSAMDYMLQKMFLMLAVPYFLVASGFFFGRKLQKSDNKREVLKNYCLRLAKPLLVFEAICVVLMIVIDGIKCNPIDALEILHRILVYPYGALWYLQAVILSLLLAFPFAKRNCFRIPIFIGCCLYLLGLLCNGYYFMVQGTPLQAIIDFVITVFYRHNLFVAFIYVVIGVKLAYTDVTPILRRLWLIIPVYVVYVIEIVLGHMKMDGGNYYFTQLLLIPLLFCLTLRVNLIRNPQLCKILRNFSTGIYLTHKSLVLPLVSLVIPNSGVVQFLVVLVISFALCALVYRAKREPLYSFLR